MFPSVGIGVTELESAFDEAKSDTTVGIVVGALRKIAVSAVEVEAFAVAVEAKMHMAGRSDTYAVLKSIFDDGNENMRGNAHLPVRR